MINIDVFMEVNAPDNKFWHTSLLRPIWDCYTVVPEPEEEVVPMRGFLPGDRVVPRNGQYAGAPGLVLEVPLHLRNVVMTNDPDRSIVVSFNDGVKRRYSISGLRFEGEAKGRKQT